jgi:predicted O-linked N-acetylglucosamine transferase (SPINDLY family)/predicted SAM-dependent methyltransferase
MTKKKSSVPQPHEPAIENPLITAINLQQEGKTAQAEALFRQVLIGSPTNPAALYSLAGILLNSNRPVEALQYATLGTESNPTFAPLWLAQGIALKALNQRNEALECWDRALKVDPKYVEALINSGVLLHEMHQPKESLLRFTRALEINPDHPTVLGNYGILLTEFKLGQQAVEAFERLLRVNPDYPYGLGLLCYERMHHCDWTDLAETTRLIIEGIRQGKATCKTLALMALSDSAKDHYLCARIFAKNYLPGHPAPLWRGERYQHARRRIAYVSPDLREHPVGHLMAGVIEAHDKTRFETIAISLGIDDHSRIRERMVSAFDHFIDAKDMHSLQIAELMRQMEVDIAIDLAGYTTDSRTEIFQHRPAPIQVNYLGYPGTMGLDCYDYILADRTVIPEEQKACYSEKPAYFDHCYLPIASGVEVAKALPRTSYGLPKKCFVFCAFSHDYKIHPDMFALWMRLLKANPGSVLWLVSRNEVSQQNLRKAAQEDGVEPDRLVFASRVPKVEDHLARYRVADLFLDTWPYNAHTTAADALLAGLPVITYGGGGSFPSRVASSLLKTLGMDELVAQSFEEYFELANDLAHKPKRLKALRSRLSPAALEGHPFLGESFTRSLERVLDGLEVPSFTPAELAAPAPSTTCLPAAPAQSSRPMAVGARKGARPSHADKLAARAEIFFDHHMSGRPWVGVHVPDSDQSSEPPFEGEIKATYFSFVDRMVALNPTIGVLLLAHSSALVAEYQRRYGTRLLCANAAHSSPGPQAEWRSPKGISGEEAAALDCLLALKCDYFIGHQGSPTAQAIAGLRTWPKGFLFLLGEKGAHAQNQAPTRKDLKKSKPVRRLHIGGKEKAEGWEILNANPAPYVDHACNANDLSRFKDNTFGEIYASHVVEHFDYNGELQNTLKEWQRVLAPGGKLYVSVPDIDILARLMLDKDKLEPNDRYAVMRMIFGGHVDKYDYHYVGLNEEFLAFFMATAGFVKIRRVPQFGIFNDTSNLVFKGTPISLNVIAEKPST